MIPVLVLNAGSSSLKWQVIRLPAGSQDETGVRLCRGKITGIGGEAAIAIQREDGASVHESYRLPDSRAAVDWVLQWLSGQGLAFGSGDQAVQAVGHRVVHGGEQFRGPAVVTEAVRRAIEELSVLAPLHNPMAVAGMDAVRDAWGAAVPQVAVFDTAFHASLPEHAFRYAIPEFLYRRHGIRRYGFHGISHSYVAMRYRALCGKTLDETNLISFHLGNGCSVAAIRAGQSVDTSMGFTPLEGLVMGTRSGDLDPAVVSRIAIAEGISGQDVERLLNTQSGLLGLSGTSSDMQTLLDAQRSDARAALAIRASLAIDVFCYRARKYLGAMLAATGGTDAVVFTGGIGENSPEIRARICEHMEWAGIQIDPERNASSKEGSIAAAGSRVAAYVIPTDEEWMIARETLSASLLAPLPMTAD